MREEREGAQPQGHGYLSACLLRSEPQDQIGAQWDLGVGAERQLLQIVSTVSFLSLKREPQPRYAPVEKPPGRGLLVHKTPFVSKTGCAPGVLAEETASWPSPESWRVTSLQGFPHMDWHSPSPALWVWAWSRVAPRTATGPPGGTAQEHAVNCLSPCHLGPVHPAQELFKNIFY